METVKFLEFRKVVMKSGGSWINHVVPDKYQENEILNKGWKVGGRFIVNWNNVMFIEEIDQGEGNKNVILHCRKAHDKIVVCAADIDSVIKCLRSAR